MTGSTPEADESETMNNQESGSLGYEKEPEIDLEYGNTGMVRGPLGHVESPASTAIGFCPHCYTNARQTTTVRGVFNCTGCTLQWYDSRVGKQTREFDDYFVKS